MGFQDQLNEVGLTGAQLCQRLGVHRNSVYKWRKHGAPQYVIAYLELLALVQGIERTARSVSD
jgi:predicted site-specific integrase-resolvase